MKYLGKIVIKELNPGYHIQLGLNRPESPLIICAQLEDEDFIKFLRNELRIKNFHLSGYGFLQLEYPEICNPQNESCKCRMTN